jgi:hypothetical protein
MGPIGRGGKSRVVEGTMGSGRLMVDQLLPSSEYASPTLYWYDPNPILDPRTPVANQCSRPSLATSPPMTLKLGSVEFHTPGLHEAPLSVEYAIVFALILTLLSYVLGLNIVGSVILEYSLVPVATNIRGTSVLMHAISAAKGVLIEAEFEVYHVLFAKL